MSWFELGAALALAVAGTPDGNGLPTTTFDTRADADFGDAAVPLRAYLRQSDNRRYRGPQHFCVVGYVGDSASRSAEVHWREARQLIHWDGGGPEWRENSISLSPRKLDLTRDVVATEADIAGSTYRVTRAWVAQVLSDCSAKGTHYTLRR